MISENLGKSLNKQMNNEFDAAQAYMAMAAYCEHQDYGGFAHFYLAQAEEERFHGMKIYEYLNDRGIHAIFTPTSKPQIDFESILDTFQIALKQEQAVTKNFYDLADIALSEKEHATISFLNWFLDEQVEEEATFDTHIQYLTRISNDKSALYLYERKLAERPFSPEE